MQIGVGGQGEVTGARVLSSQLPELKGVKVVALKRAVRNKQGGVDPNLEQSLKHEYNILCALKNHQKVGA